MGIAVAAAAKIMPIGPIAGVAQDATRSRFLR